METLENVFAQYRLRHRAWTTQGRLRVFLDILGFLICLPGLYWLIQAALEVLSNTTAGTFSWNYWWLPVGTFIVALVFWRVATWRDYKTTKDKELWDNKLNQHMFGFSYGERLRLCAEHQIPDSSYQPELHLPPPEGIQHRRAFRSFQHTCPDHNCILYYVQCTEVAEKKYCTVCGWLSDPAQN